MSFAYPGKGMPLYRASSNAQEPVQPPVLTIPDLSNSIGFPCNDAVNGITLLIEWASAPTGDTLIKGCNTPDFVGEFTLDTIAAGTDTQTWWTTNAQLPGFLRIYNDSNKTINYVYAQKKAANFG